MDVFDGLLATRLTRTESQKALGEPLDSLVDMCGFGFAPVIFGYCFGLREWFSVMILALYLFSCAPRLAYFDSAGFYRVDGTEYYIGMPTTFAALFFPNLFILNFFVAKQTMVIILIFTYLGMAIAMVAGFRMAKRNPKRLGLPRRYTVLPSGALVLTIVYGYAMVS